LREKYSLPNIYYIDVKYGDTHTSESIEDGSIVAIQTRSQYPSWCRALLIYDNFGNQLDPGNEVVYKIKIEYYTNVKSEYKQIYGSQLYEVLFNGHSNAHGHLCCLRVDDEACASNDIFLDRKGTVLYLLNT
jgi:hypothetical protein